MYTERYSLPFLAGVLISALERRRLGLGPWGEKARAELRALFDAELAAMRSHFFELFDDRAYWEKVERTLTEVCFTRYCAVAEKQTNLEARDYGLWRGGDLIARAVYAASGLIVGILMVRLPFVPIPQTWDLFALATMIGAPFLPDAQVWLHKRKYRKQLEAIVADMRQAEEQLRLYQSLNEPAGTSPQAVSSVAEEPAARQRAPGDRSRNGG